MYNVPQQIILNQAFLPSNFINIISVVYTEQISKAYIMHIIGTVKY